MKRCERLNRNVWQTKWKELNGKLWKTKWKEVEDRWERAKTITVSLSVAVARFNHFKKVFRPTAISMFNVSFEYD